VTAAVREQVWAIVVGAGSGERLGADRPKAFVRLAGRTLLAASLVAFEDHDDVDGIVVVVPEGWEERTTLLADDLCAGKIAAAVAGGPTRGRSVVEGLRALPPSARYVLVHDAARPLVSHALIDRVVAALRAGAQAVVPGLPISDTVKRVHDGGVAETLDRAALCTVQTPQGFVADVLREACTGDLDAATDCSSLVERAGGRVVVVEGDPRNLKVTTPDDLARAESLLADA
jgi:2-C-methyl-D-erythritol 4-phosphate cytidylyltransferase